MGADRLLFRDSWTHLFTYHAGLLGANAVFAFSAAASRVVPVAEWSLLWLLVTTIVVEKYVLEYETPALSLLQTSHVRYILYRTVVSMYLLSFVVAVAMWWAPPEP